MHPQLMMQPRQIRKRRCFINGPTEILCACLASGQTVFEPVANVAGPPALASPSDAAKWGFNVGSFTVPQAPAGPGDQQPPQPVAGAMAQAPAPAPVPDKKSKTGKKSKTTTQNVQQIYSTTDANGIKV